MELVFCPSCNGAVYVAALPVVTIRRHPEYGPRIIEVKLGEVAYCDGCSLVSEVQGTVLIDLGRMSLEDLEAPFVPGMFEPRVLIQSGSTLLWGRRDS